MRTDDAIAGILRLAAALDAQTQSAHQAANLLRENLDTLTSALEAYEAEYGAVNGESEVRDE